MQRRTDPPKEGSCEEHERAKKRGRWAGLLWRVWGGLCLVGFFVGGGGLFSLEGAQALPGGSGGGRYLISAPLSLLRGAGLRVEEVRGVEGVAQVSGAQLRSLRQRGGPLRVHAIAGTPLPEEYLDLDEIHKKMKGLVATFPAQARMVNLNDWLKTPRTVEKRSLWALELHADLRSDRVVPVALLDSLHHAREMITPLVTLDAAQFLLEGYGKDTQVTRWLEGYRIWIVPVVNPDGYHHIFTQNIMWRKNRRPNADGSWGVDLNRNYPFLWGACGRSSNKGKDEIYRGTAPASEPEVQTMVALGQRLRPLLYLTYHSYGNEVVRPYVCASMAEEPLIAAISQQVARAAGYTYRKPVSSGESFEHFYNRYGSLSFLIEVGTVFHPPPQDLDRLVAQARRTWQALFTRGLGSSLQGLVRSASSGKPLVAEFSLDEVSFQSGEIRRTFPETGWFGWVLLPGSYHLRVKAPGYELWSQLITIRERLPLKLSISLRSPLDDQEKLPHEPSTNESPSEIPDEQRTTDEPRENRDGGTERPPEHTSSPDSPSWPRDSTKGASPPQGCQCRSGGFSSGAPFSSPGAPLFPLALILFWGLFLLARSAKALYRTFGGRRFVRRVGLVGLWLLGGMLLIGGCTRVVRLPRSPPYPAVRLLRVNASQSASLPPQKRYLWQLQQKLQRFSPIFWKSLEKQTGLSGLSGKVYLRLHFVGRYLKECRIMRSALQASQLRPPPSSRPAFYYSSFRRRGKKRILQRLRWPKKDRPPSRPGPCALLRRLSWPASPPDKSVQTIDWIFQR